MDSRTGPRLAGRQAGERAGDWKDGRGQLKRVWGMGGLSLLPESQWKKWLILAGPVLSHVLHVLLHVAGVFLGNYCCDPE